jgi:hypothetical protein
VRFNNRQFHASARLRGRNQVLLVLLAVRVGKVAALANRDTASSYREACQCTFTRRRPSTAPMNVAAPGFSSMAAEPRLRRFGPLEPNFPLVSSELHTT